MNILYQFNEKYAPYAGVSVTSLFINNKDVSEITVWILGEGLSEDSIGKFNELSTEYKREIKFVNTDELIEKIKTLNIPSYRGSYAANLRLFVSEVFPEDIDRVLYLDSDTIISGNLERLLEYDLNGRTIGMVYDSIGEIHKEEIGLNKEDKYFNSGVILFDMNRWREKKYTEAIVEHVRKVCARYTCPDQDLLNLVCFGDICALSPSYNFQPFHQVYSDRVFYDNFGKAQYYAQFEIEDARNDVKIYHSFRFLGEFPWNKNNIHPDRERFDRYLANSPWKGYVKPLPDGGIVVKIEKVLFEFLPRGMFVKMFYRARKISFRKEKKKLTA